VAGVHRPRAGAPSRSGTRRCSQRCAPSWRGADALLDDLRLSLDFYGAQEAAVPVERIVLCGPGSAIAGLAERIELGLGLPIATGRPEALGALDASSAARLTLPYGLALEA
jgi:Tfp pilus assembly PilM family ATPase